MDIKRVEDVPANAVEVDGASGVQIQWLVGAEDRPEHFYMRLFILQPGGHTPQHDHRWEHEVFVLEGEGTVVTADGEQRIGRSSVIHVRPGETHQFCNSGDRPLKFLCLVPVTAAY